MSEIPAPTNKVVRAIEIVLDTLIEGLGPEVAYRLLVLEFPVVGAPFLGLLTKFAIDSLAKYLNKHGTRLATIMVIRFQNDIRKAEYEAALVPIRRGDYSEAELAAARAAIDRLVRRSK